LNSNDISLFAPIEPLWVP